MRSAMGAAAFLACAGYAAAQTAQLPEVRVTEGREAQLPSLAKPVPTASRLGLSLRELPASAEVVEQATLQDRGVNTLAESARGMTGLASSVRPGAGAVFSSRGFVENGLGVLFDGIRIGGATITSRNYDAFNFDRIELLRGPASVLYGEGAGAGALNFVRRAPVQGPLRSEVLLQAGSGGQLRLGGAVAGSVGERTDVSLAYSRNAFDGPADAQSTRLAHLVAGLRFRVDDTTAWFAEADWFKANVDNPYWGTPLVAGRLAPQLARKNYNLAADNLYEDTVRWLRGGLTARIAGVDYKGQLYQYQADRDWRNFYAFSATNVPGRIQPRAVENLAYDHRLWGTRHEAGWDQFGGRSRTTLGLEYQSTDFNSPRSTAGGRPDFDPINPQPAIFAAFGTPRVDSRRADVEQAALFAENRFALMRDVKLVTGLRHNRLDATLRRPDTALAFDKDFSYTDWRAGLVWDPSAAHTVYATYATGREPVESLFIYDPAQRQFDLTRYRLAEIGSKSSFAGGQGEFTAAVYDLQRQDIPAADPVTPGAFAQVGKQSSRGVELSAAWRPVAALLLEANAAVLRARFDTPVNFVGGVGAVAAGAVPPNVAQEQFYVAATWRLTPQWALGANVQHVGERQGNIANTLMLPAYTRADAWVRYAFGAKTDLTLRVRNLADKLYVDWASSGFGQTNVYYAEGRRAELVLRSAF
jgi:iron complex outermembrane receptor protein